MADQYLPKDIKPSEAGSSYLPEGVSPAGEEHVKIISHPQPRVYTDEDRRRDALEIAQKSHPGFKAPDVVAAAKEYENYLKGE